MTTADWLHEQVLRDLTQALLYAVVVASFATLWILLRRRHPERQFGPSRETLILSAIYLLSFAVGMLVFGLVAAYVVSEMPGLSS